MRPRRSPPCPLSEQVRRQDEEAGGPTTPPSARARRARLVLLDRGLQIVPFVAATATEAVQLAQMSFGAREVSAHEIRLADVFVRAAMVRLKSQRLVVVTEGAVEIARVAIGESEQVVRVGVARIACEGVGEKPDRVGVLPSAQGLARR